MITEEQKGYFIQMKYIKSKCLQKAEGRKIGKYLITLEVTDSDINMFEDLAHAVIEKKDKKKYDNYLANVFRTLQKLWRKYDT